jgi:hypothetical protein
MTPSVLQQAPIAARALATRLRMAALVRSSSLPELLQGLTVDGVHMASIDVVERALLTSQRIVRRLPRVPDTCLYRALTRYALLRRAGHPARFVMAIDPSAPDVEGHAWVELDGKPVGETIDKRYVVTFAYPKRLEHPERPS